MIHIRSISQFERNTEKILSDYELSILNRYREALSTNPLQGKALGPFWFREIKIGSKRVYFIVGKKMVLLIGVSTKNAQRGAIALYRSKLSELKKTAD